MENNYLTLVRSHLRLGEISPGRDESLVNDTSVNEYGEQLLDLCIETKLRILNRKTPGDLPGHSTYVGFHGCSTVDLVLASEITLTESTIVQYLSVQELNFLSDYGPILLKLARNYNFIPNKLIEEIQICELKNKPTRYT